MNTRSSDGKSSRSRGKPATTPEGRENQLISLATDLAQKRLEEGTATAAEVVHFLKLGSSREKLEQARLQQENRLMEAKIGNLNSQQKSEELFQEAINAMRSYTGQGPLHEEAGYEDPDLY
jgi:hypothetical protein